MIASIFSTLSGTLAGKHPELPVLVDVEGRVYNKLYGKYKTYTWVTGYTDSRGYKAVGIKNKSYFVHRLVAQTFLPNPENKRTVDHIDRNPSNNRLSNLRWATHKEQIRNSSTLKHPDIDVGFSWKSNPIEYRRVYKRLYKQKEREEAAASSMKGHSEQPK